MFSVTEIVYYKNIAYAISCGRGKTIANTHKYIHTYTNSFTLKRCAAKRTIENIEKKEKKQYSNDKNITFIFHAQQSQAIPETKFLIYNSIFNFFIPRHARN